ncbi:MAG: hypothetical protein WDO24_03695 [Pseudomonadota bacterium]
MHIANVQIVHGDTLLGGDALALDDPTSGGVTIDHVASITGSGGNDLITLADGTPTTIVGGGGIDSVQLDGLTSMVSVANIASVHVVNPDATSTDVTVTALGNHLDVDLGSGNNTLTLDAPGAAAITLGSSTASASHASGIEDPDPQGRQLRSDPRRHRGERRPR